MSTTAIQKPRYITLLWHTRNRLPSRAPCSAWPSGSARCRCCLPRTTRATCSIRPTACSRQGTTPKRSRASANTSTASPRTSPSSSRRPSASTSSTACPRPAKSCSSSRNSGWTSATRPGSSWRGWPTPAISFARPSITTRSFCGWRPKTTPTARWSRTRSGGAPWACNCCWSPNRPSWRTWVKASTPPTTSLPPSPAPTMPTASTSRPSAPATWVAPAPTTTCPTPCSVTSSPTCFRQPYSTASGRAWRR